MRASKWPHECMGNDGMTMMSFTDTVAAKSYEHGRLFRLDASERIIPRHLITGHVVPPPSSLSHGIDPGGDAAGMKVIIGWSVVGCDSERRLE